MERRPHILLITTDQQRWDALGINGNSEIETPNLDALANGGVNFCSAYSTAPVCIPARRTLLSGLHPDSHGLHRYADGLEWDPPHTLPGLLSRAGYQTQLVGKMHLHPQGKRYGFDNIILSETPNWRPTSPVQHRNDYVAFLRDQGVMEHPQFHGINGNGRLARPHPFAEHLQHSAWLTGEAVRFLTERRDPSCPFFLHLSFTHPHPPLTPPQAYWDRYCDREFAPPWMGQWVPQDGQSVGVAPDAPVGPFTAESIRLARAGYYALINQIDDCVAHLLERWFEYGNPRAREPLWILFTSDHGEMLGDHHLFRKTVAYEGSSHIPFFIRGYHVEAAAGTSDDLICLEDVLPTLLDLAGIERPDGLDGLSLAGVARGQPEEFTPREQIHGECGGHLFIRSGRTKYLYWPASGEEQLFDLVEDPQERRDLSGSTDLLAKPREALRRRMVRLGRWRGDESPPEFRPLAGGPPSVFFSTAGGSQN